MTSLAKNVNKVWIPIPNRRPGNKFKIEGFWFVFKSSCYYIFTNFPKKIKMAGVEKCLKALYESVFVNTDIVF